MTITLSSLRVSAGLDASDFVTGSAAIVAANQRSAAASKVAAEGLAYIEASAGKTSRAFNSLSGQYVEGVTQALKFQRAIDQLGRQMDIGNGTAEQHGRILDGIYRRYGMQANATALAERGYAQLAGMVDVLNAKHAANIETMQREAAATQRLADAQKSAAASTKLGSLSYTGGSFLNDQDIAQQRAALMPLVAAQQQYEAQTLKLNQAVKAGVITEKERTALIGTARARLLDQTNEVRKAEEANARLTKGVGLNAYAWQNLGYQVNDVVTSLASGISPFQTLAQQGGQIYQVLGSARGGVAGALADIRDRLLAINPLVGVFGLLAAGAIGATVAAQRYANAQRDIQLGLLGVGQGAGLSADQIDLIARRAADSAKISVSAAREIEVEFLKTGRVFGDVFQQGVIAAENFSKATKQDRNTAAGFLSQNLSTLGSGGYEELAKRAGNFDASLERQVRGLIDAGNTMDAQRLVVERFGQAYDKVGDKLTTMDRIIGALSRGWDGLTDAIGRGVSRADKSLAQQLDETDKAISIRKGLSGQTGQDDPQIRALEERQSRLQEAIRQTGQATQKSAETTRSNLDALNKTAVNAAVPEIVQFERLKKELEASNTELNALENAAKPDPDRIQAAGLAQARLAGAARDYAAAGSVANAEYEKGVRLLRAEAAERAAVSPEQKASAARLRSEAETYLTRNSAQERAVKSQDAYNKVLLDQREASKRASDAQIESTKTANDLAGATTQTGKSIEYLSAARKVDEQIANGSISAADRETKIREQLKSQLAGVNQQYAERVRASRDQTNVQESLNNKVAAGTMVTAEAQRRQGDLLEITRLQREADAASGVEKENLQTRIRELTAATEAQMSAEDRLRVLGMIDSEKDRIAVLQKEIELRGASVQVRNRELAILQATQQLENIRKGASLTPEGKELINQAGLRANLDTSKQQFEKFAQDISSILAGIFDDMFKAGNKGLTGFLDSFSRGFARLGTRMLEQNVLSPLFGGQGGFAGGPSAGGLFDFSQIERAIQKGSEGGVGAAFEELLKPRSGVSGAAGGAATSKFGSALLPGITGAAVGYQTQSPLMGALGGGLTGLATGGPIGAVIGAGAGLLGGLFGQSEAEKAREKQRQQDRQQYELNRPAQNEFRMSLRGEATAGNEATIRAQYQQFFQAATEAQKVGDTATAQAMQAEMDGFAQRLRSRFAETYPGVLADVRAGFGPQGPFGTAAATIQALGETMKGFVADAQGAGLSADQARAAAQKGILAAVEGPKALSQTGEALEALKGRAASAKSALVELGMSADQAADAVRERTSRALKEMRSSFGEDLDSKIASARGQSYIGDVADLLKERTGLLSDAKSLGTSRGKVGDYFDAAAQKIVNDAGLTGAAFDDLLKRFPALRGHVKEFSEALDVASAKAAAASRALGFQDRLFAATNDTSTLAGQLAAYDRQARQERLDEEKAGGEVLNDLLKAQAAERLKIQRDFNSQAIQADKQRYDAIRSYLKDLTTSDLSPLSPQDKLAAAQAKYNADLASARAGNAAGLEAITGSANTLLEAAKGYYASSQGYQDIFGRVTQDLGALPKQASDAQKIVDAVNASKTAIVTSTGGTTTSVNSAKTAVNSNTLVAKDQRELLRAINNYTDLTRQYIKTGNETLGEIKSLNDTQNATLALLNKQFTVAAPIPVPGRDPLNNNMIDALNKIVYNTAQTVLAVRGNEGNKFTGVGTYAMGGYTGPGGKYDVAGIVHKGEYVIDADATRRLGVPMLDALRGGLSGALTPVAPPPMPVLARNDNGGMAAMAREIAALRGQVRELQRLLSEGNDIAENGHLGTISATRGVKASVERSERAASRQALARKPQAA